MKLYSVKENLPLDLLNLFFIENNDFTFVNNVKEADYVLIPLSLEYYFGKKFRDIAESLPENSLQNLIEISKKAKKPLLAIHFGDDQRKFPLPKNTVLFRTAITSHNQTPTTFVYPAFSNFTKVENPLITLEKTSQATIGFCGAALKLKMSVKDNLLSFIENTYSKINHEYNSHAYNIGYKLRRKAIDLFTENPQVQQDFIEIMDGYWGNDHKAQQKINKNTFIQNILSNGYNLVIRGRANYSYRLFEVLALGRIPVFVETKAPLPFESEIDWDKHLLYVKQNDIGKIDKLLVDFHNKQTATSFKEIQQSNYNLHYQYFDKTGFLSGVKKVLLKINATASNNRL